MNNELTQLKIGIAMITASWVNAMLIWDNLPELWANLVTALTGLKMDNLSHTWISGLKETFKSRKLILVTNVFAKIRMMLQTEKTFDLRSVCTVGKHLLYACVSMATNEYQDTPASFKKMGTWWMSRYGRYEQPKMLFDGRLNKSHCVTTPCAWLPSGDGEYENEILSFITLLLTLVYWTQQVPQTPKLTSSELYKYLCFESLTSNWFASEGLTSHFVVINRILKSR